MVNLSDNFQTLFESSFHNYSDNTSKACLIYHSLVNHLDQFEGRRNSCDLKVQTMDYFRNLIIKDILEAEKFKSTPIINDLIYKVKTAYGIDALTSLTNSAQIIDVSGL